MSAVELPQPTPAIVAGRPLVSVIVPCFGEGRYLDDCLYSIRDQTYAHLEIIVIDDAGTDDSLAVALGHAVDPRVRVLRCDRNVGLGSIRNLGLAGSRGDLVAFVDGDDMLPPGSVATRVATFARLLADRPRPERALIAGVYGDWQYTTPDATATQPIRRSAQLGAIDLASSGGGNIFTVSAPLVRHDIMRLAGGFAPDVGGGEDLLAWRRVLDLGVMFMGREQVVHLYRQKPTSMLRAAGAEVAAFTAAARARVDERGEPLVPPTPVRRGMQRLQAFHDGAYPMPWGKPRRARTHLAAVGVAGRPTPSGEPRVEQPWPTTPPPSGEHGPGTDFDHLVAVATSFLDGPPPDPPAVKTVHFLHHRDGVVTSSTHRADRRRHHDVLIVAADRAEGRRAGALASRLAVAGVTTAIAGDHSVRTGVLDAWFLLGAVPDGVLLTERQVGLDALVTTAPEPALDTELRVTVGAIPPGAATVIVVDDDVDAAWLERAEATARATADAAPAVLADTSARARRLTDAGHDVRAASIAQMAAAGHVITADGEGAALAALCGRPWSVVADDRVTRHEPADASTGNADQVSELIARVNRLESHRGDNRPQ